MTIQQATQKAIQQFGKDILNELRFVNILSDFGAFQNPAYRTILEKAIAARFAQAILALTDESLEFKNLKINALADTIATKNGFQLQLVTHLLRSVAAALDSTVPIPAEEDEPNEEDTTTVYNCRINLIKVEGGAFSLGATPEQGIYASFDEKPAVNVKIDSFYIADAPVTQALWRAVMEIETPSHFNGFELPVERVTWFEANEFILRLNERYGREFRLPTEAEWEFAARGGVKSRHFKYAGCNDKNLKDFCWMHDNSDATSHEVKLKKPNELGIYDMSGNIGEWCQDWYHNSYALNGVFENPKGPPTGAYKVIRGGSWNAKASDCRVSKRLYMNPDYKTRYVGFRLAASFI